VIIPVPCGRPLQSQLFRNLCFVVWHLFKLAVSFYIKQGQIKGILRYSSYLINFRSNGTHADIVGMAGKEGALTPGGKLAIE
jgi:hypothetical protein